MIKINIISFINFEDILILCPRPLEFLEINYFIRYKFKFCD